MDANTRYIIVVCLAGILGLGIVFGIAAMADAPGRQKWYQLAARVGLKAETFFRIGRIRLVGDFQGRYVTVEQCWTPDPQDPKDAEKGVLWVRVRMATNNARHLAFMFGSSDVLEYAAGRLAKQFENMTSAALVNPEIPQEFFVNVSSMSFIRSLLERNREIKHALVAAKPPHYFQLDGSQLSYTELGSALMDQDEVEKSAGRLKLILRLMEEITQQVETQSLPG